MKTYNIFCFLVAFLFSTNLFADTLDVFVDKNVLSEADILYLTVEYNGSNSNTPDFSSVLDDFQIVQNSSSSQYSFINGNITQTKKWTLGLKAKKTGKITIKPIKMGKLTSNYVDVEVKELSNVAYIPDSKQNFNSPYFEIKQNIDTSTPYVNQQMLMSVTILDTIGLNNGNLAVVENTKKNWIIQPLLKEPIKKIKNINGKKTNVVTFLFALFPQKSGKIELPQYSFEGEYVKDVGFGFSNFDDAFAMFDNGINSLFGQSVPVKMKTNLKIIDVKPAADGIRVQDWLPLKDIKVTGVINSEKKITVGETFNYEITIVATGTAKNLLPLSLSPDVIGAKKYPEKPVFVEEVQDKNVVTTAKYNTVYIPEKAGEIVIPKMDIKWFNLNTNTIETISVEEKKIKVTSDNVVFDVIDSQTDTSNNSKETTVSDDKTKDVTNPINLKIKIKYLIYILVFLIIALVYKKHKNNPINCYKKEVIDSIKKKNYKQTKLSIIEWAKIRYKNKDINNFKDIVCIVKDKEFEKQLDILNKLLYSSSEEVLDVNIFIKTFKSVGKNKKAKSSDCDVLPNLYE